MDDLKEILWQQDEGVVTLSLSRPSKRNAITGLMLAELLAAIERCEDDSSVRTIVIRGTGKGFCPGDDLSGMGEVPPGYLDKLRRPVTHAGLQTSLREIQKPVIAAIHGFAFGVGLDLAMACDFRIAEENAIFQDQRVIQRGMHAVTGCAWFQPRAIGLTRAMEFLILGEPMSAAEAKSAGMVTACVSAPEFEQRIAELSNRLAIAPTKAIGLMKRQIYSGLHMSHEEFMAFAAPLIQQVQIKDRQEGIRAFLEKRAPDFTGE